MRTKLVTLLFGALFLPACGVGLCVDELACNALSGAYLSWDLTSSFEFGTRAFLQDNDRAVLVTNQGALTAENISASSLSSPFGFKGGVYPGTGGTCGTELGPGGSCTLVLTFNPAPPVNSFSQSLSLSYSGGLLSSLESELRGTGDNGSFVRTSGPMRSSVQKVIRISSGMYVVGSFSHWNGSVAGGIVRLNDDMTVDTTFNTGTGAPATHVVYTIAPSYDGTKIYIGGSFLTFNGNTALRIARLNLDGSFDSTFTHVGTGLSNTVTGIAAAADGTVYVSGSFTNYNATNRNYIARLTSGGALDATFNPGTGLSAAPNEIELDTSGNLYISGGFTTYNSVGCGKIIRVLPTGAIDGTFATVGTGFNNGISNMIFTSRGIVVSGTFTTYNTATSRNRIARIDYTGALDTTFDPGTGFNMATYGITEVPDGSGKLLVTIGASVTITYNGTPVGMIAQLYPDGTLNTNWGQGLVGKPPQIFAQPRYIVAKSDGVSYMAGQFNEFAQTMVNSFVRLTATGAIDNPVADVGIQGHPAHSHTVEEIAFAPDGSGVIVGGAFRIIGDKTPRLGLGKMTLTGLPDTSFDATAQSWYQYSMTSGMHSFAMTSSGKLYFIWGDDMGVFPAFRLNTDGSVDTTFSTSSGLGSNQGTLALATDDTDDIFVGGSFTTYLGTNRRRIARIKANGTVDPSFAQTGTGISNNIVNGILPLRDGSGKVYVGGTFTDYNTTSRNRILRLNADGSLDTTFNPGTGFDNAVTNMVFVGDGTDDIYVFGSFTTYNSTGRVRIARITPTGALHTGFVPIGTSFNNTVSDIAVVPDGSGAVYATGAFTQYDTTAAGGIIRLLANGQIDTTFNYGTGFDISPQVLKVAIDGTNDLYVGGMFTVYKNTVRQFIVRLSPTGDAD